MAPVFQGWNVWGVWQSRDLSFDPLMVGVSRDSRLRIWVEDHVRLEAAGTEVADPIMLKGDQIQILNGRPNLAIEKRKEELPGDTVPVLDPQSEPPDLRYVRFFNRGQASFLPWPHDGDYLLEEVLRPDPNNPVTAGPGPGTAFGRNVGKPGEDILKKMLILAAIGAGGVLLVKMVESRSRRTA